jgi:hypothetical protein
MNKKSGRAKKREPGLKGDGKGASSIEEVQLRIAEKNPQSAIPNQ